MKKLKVLATLVAILMMCTAVNFVPAITASAKTVNHQVVSASDDGSDDDSSFDEDDSGDFAYSKIVTLNNPKSVKYTVKNLSSKKKYYVRTRTYKKIGKT